MEFGDHSVNVISYKNLPAKMPVTQSIVFCLLLDRLQVPGFVWGIAISMIVIWWIIAIYVFFYQKTVDIFEIKLVDNSEIIR